MRVPGLSWPSHTPFRLLVVVTMFIKEVVIDGFKSYARKTEING